MFRIDKNKNYNRTLVIHVGNSLGSGLLGFLNVDLRI